MISVYAGYVVVKGTRIQVDFEADSAASKQEIDSAFLAELGKVVELNYLVIGESTGSLQVVESVCQT